MDDAWADFRFLGDGKTPVWSLTENKGWWVLSLSGPAVHGMVGIEDMGRARIPIMPSGQDENIALDASLEFLDRLRERRVPKFIDSPDSLMSFCVKAAVRQR